jgi:hypothetical protein
MRKDFQDFLIRTVQIIYQNTTIIIKKESINDNAPIDINKGV